jgi:hypothetical protein
VRSCLLDEILFDRNCAGALKRKGRGEKLLAAASMESMLKPMRSGDQDVLDKDASVTPQGGVNDTYGEDAATQDVAITPWARLVARFV